MEDGKTQEFKIPQGQKFDVDGQMVDAWGLKKGMKVTATKITVTPETVVVQKVKVTGTMPPPPPAKLPILTLSAWSFLLRQGQQSHACAGQHK
jgi:hypothetical protein